MSDSKFVCISGVEIGKDSASGLAFACEIDGETTWVPYSQCRARHINKKLCGADSIEIPAWLAEKNGWEGEPC